jgi:hypothetical protein
MSVDFHWRRVPGRSLRELSPKQLGALVPHCFEDEFTALHSAGMVMAVTRNGYLMHFALAACSAGSGVAELPVFGGERRTEGEEDPEYGFIGTEVWVLRPEEVRRASRFLDRTAVDDLVRGLDDDLAREVRSLGFSTPWSREWADALTADLRKLTRFFAAAAAAGDAMVKFESA